MAYTDLDNLLADLMPEISSTAQKAAVGRVLAGVDTFIDRYCRRPRGYFNVAGETATMKRFRGEGERYLRIPVHVAGSIEIAGIADSAFYEADNGWPYLIAIDDLTGVLDSDTEDDDYRRGIFANGRLYEVTARWGFSAVPLEIDQASRLLTQKVWETQRGVLGDITPSGYVVERAMPLFVRETLDLYRRGEFER